MERITIQSRITKEDYRKATMFGAFGKTPMMKFLMFIAVPVGLLQFAQAIYSGMIAYPLTFYSSIVMFGLIAIMYFVINWDINRFIKTDRVLLDNVRTIYIEENGITSLQPDLTEVTYEYDRFFNAYEINGYFLIYADKVSAIILAKRDILPEDIEKMRKILSEKFGKRFIVKGVK